MLVTNATVASQIPTQYVPRMPCLSRAVFFGFVLCASCHADEPATAVRLLNGADLSGWELITPQNSTLSTVCELHANRVLSVAGKPVGYLQTKESYENYRLHFEWRWTDQPGNSGVLLHIASGPIDRKTWPLCHQIQMKHTRAGDVLPMAGATFAEPLSTPAQAATPQLNHTAPDSENPTGQWNTCEILCLNGAIDVTLNGVLQNHVTHCAPSSGHVGFQLEGAPYELRNLVVELIK
jgi:hypothetical protein